MSFSVIISLTNSSPEGNTADGSTDIESNAGNRAEISNPLDARSDSIHDASARTGPHARETDFHLNFNYPVRNVGALNYNILLADTAMRYTPPGTEGLMLLREICYCYTSARAAALETQGVVSRCAPRTVSGPLPRPLPLAAIFQNVNARIERVLAIARSGPCLSSDAPIHTAGPIRYDDAYDNMLGSRSIDDGTAAAYAHRDGAEATNELRFGQGYHNGLRFGRAHVHITTTDRNLVEARQARYLAGLSTRTMDAEITARIMRDTDSWGWVGRSCFERVIASFRSYVRESEWAQRDLEAQ